MVTQLGILFGGQSSEHEVSLVSAAFVMQTCSQLPDVQVYPIGITKTGEWYLCGDDPQTLNLEHWQPGPSDRRVLLAADAAVRGLVFLDRPDMAPIRLDLVFPVLHGRFGEDGTVQGLLEMARIPYVGCGLLSSAVAMDKVVAKTLFAMAGLPQTPWLAFTAEDWAKHAPKWRARLAESLGYPLFIKPANAGSSVGISKVNQDADLDLAVKLAAQHDRKIVAEAAVKGREIEIAGLGAETPFLSVCGEIVPEREFYDYTAKYEDAASRLIIPAELPEEVLEELRELAVRAWQALDCHGLARIDFFVQEQEPRVLINEINTIPGFTSISMYPKLLEHSGVPATELMQRLLTLARQRFDSDRTGYP